jgi:hypothetical protein
MDTISAELIGRISWSIRSSKPSMFLRPCNEQGEQGKGKLVFVDLPRMLLDTTICPEHGPVIISSRFCWPVGCAAAASAPAGLLLLLLLLLLAAAAASHRQHCHQDLPAATESCRQRHGACCWSTAR